MTVAILLMAMAFAANAQMVLEDFRCRHIVAAIPGNPTILTCDEPHRMEGLHAFTYGSLAASQTPGSTLMVDGVSYTLQTAIDNGVEGQVLIGPNQGTTTQNLLHAINDDGIGKGTNYSSATSAHPTAFAMFAGGSMGQAFLVYAQAAGMAGTSVTVSASGSLTVTGTVLKLQWMAMLTGATGAWTGMGSTATPKFYNNPASSNMATYVSPTQFSIPFNSAGLTWDQVNVQARRASGDGTSLVYGYTDSGWATTDNFVDGWQIVEPACTDTSNDLACSGGYTKPENQKGYMCRGGSISDLSVSGGTITLTLNGLWQNCSTYPALAPGVVVWPRGFYAYTTGTNPLSLPAQPLAGYFASMGTNNTACGGPRYPANLNDCEGFVVQTVDTVNNGSQTQITIRNPGLQDGDYGSGTCTTHCMGSTSAAGYLATTWLASPYGYFLPRWGGYYAPGIGTIGTLKSGLYPPPTQVNRLIANVTYNVNIDRRGTYAFELGTYVEGQPGSLQGSMAHYYHDLDFRVYANQRYKLEFTGVPSHQVNEPGTGRWMANPNSFSPYYGFAGSGNPAYSYWYGMADFYFDGPNSYTTVNPTPGISPTYRSILMDTVLGEPDEWVPNRASVWSPQRYIGGVLTDSPGYEVHWFTANTGALYQVRYSSVTSLKTVGWSNATDGGTVSAQNSYEYYWQSPVMGQQQPGVWIGIRPVMPVTWAATVGNAFWVGTDLDPAMTAGDHVTVWLNGTTATDVASTSVQPRQVWWLYQPSYPYQGVWSGSGGLLNIVAFGGTCTANFSGNHNLVPGWKIKVLGTINTALGSGMYDQSTVDYRVTATPTPQSLQFSCPGVPSATYASDGNAAAGTHMAIMSYPGVLVPGNSPGYAGGGSMVSTEENKGFAEISLLHGGPKPLLRLAENPTSQAVILAYNSPDTGACSTAVSGSGTGTGAHQDAGGLAARTAVFGGLSAATPYTFEVLCGQGSTDSVASYTTGPTPQPGQTRQVTVAATPPATTNQADNLVIEYGSSPSALNTWVNAACAGSGRCTGGFTANRDSVIWVRRRWCRNRGADPGCANPANELGRSLADPISVP